ncbi:MULTISPECIES: hypothetical protein [unclassified Nocardiopsis]|jgi:hypothetical protein|uniref:hypothetical protein n=1 Tax=unclassified Nocardiopsis TaxID=2649073 RepID=UPI00066DF10D|nr:MULTISPECIES: hypothetical protein [unclassified Nocardiopsis]MBQ1080878.1 hypothetical protein [Nocardiopsis sp. B62]
MLSAHAVPAPLFDPADLVGQWVRVKKDGTVGLLTRADHTGWALRTPTGALSGRGRLVAEPLTRRSEAGPVRRRLRALKDDPGFPGAADLDLLDLQLAAHP